MNIFKITIVGVLLSLIAGCAVPRVDVMIKVPGELNLQNVSKIAVVDFNTLENSESNGVKSVSPAILKMAKGCIQSAFYKDPFYTLADLNVEKGIKKEKINAQLSKRLDAIIYGRLWWETTPEYKNIYPKVFNLKSWTTRKYKSGKNPITGKPIYSTVDLTTQTKDVLENIPYRGKTYSLMLELNIYSIGKGGQLSKLTRFFEVAKVDEIINNGTVSSTMEIINKKNVKNKLTAIKSEKEKSSFSFFKSSKKDKKGITGDVNVVKKSETISCDMLAAEKMIKHLGKVFCDKIAPHYEKISIEINENEHKSTELLKNSAYHAARKYLVDNVLAQDNKYAKKHLYNLDFESASKSLAIANGKKEGYKVYKKDLPEYFEDFTDDNRESIMNYAICEEALGEYERALNIYRFLFKAEPNENLASGISRCLFALDMADKVTEKVRNKRKASKKQKLN